MTTLPRTRFLAVVAVGLLWAPVAAWAQGTPKAAPSAAGGVEARVEAYARKLHAELQITPAEEAEWKEYVAVMQENARDMARTIMERTRQLDSMNAVENLKSYERLSEAHVERLQKLIPAFEKLYDAMPAQQKKIADEVFRASAKRHIAAHARGSSHGGH
jgi:hypothetical protein